MWMTNRRGCDCGWPPSRRSGEQGVLGVDRFSGGGVKMTCGCSGRGGAE